MEAISTLIIRELETIVDDSDRVLDFTRVIDCFNIFTICIRKARTTQAFEQLATACAGCFCHTFYHLKATDPTSSILEDLHQCYYNALPLEIDSTGLPRCHPMIMVGALIGRKWSARPIWRDNYRPSGRQHVQFARDITELAQAEYRQGHEVPEWIVDFAFDSLSLDPLPSASIIANCFKIVAISMGCGVPNATTLNEKYIYFCPIHTYLLTAS